MDFGGLLVALVAFVMALVALNKIARLDVKLAQLKLDIGKLGDELQKNPAAGVAPEKPKKPKPAAATPARQAVKVEHFEAAPAAEPAATPPQQVEAAVPPPSPKRAGDMEQALASRWFVWIGGVAIAIGGLLFVKYAYDNGLISPALQVILGLLAGLGLVGGGEFVRRKGMAGAEREASYVPAALSASGLAVMFASIYAAHALYAIVQPATAFAGLALVALGSLALSRRQGPLIAALGLIGSYVTPALIPSPDPNAWSFFPYLLVVLVACFAVLRSRTWWWLGYSAVAGAAIWSLLWIGGGVFEQGDVWPAGIFAHLIGFVSFYGLRGRAILAEDSGSLLAPSAMSQPLVIGLSGLAAETIVLAALALATAHGTVSLYLFMLAMAGLLAMAWTKPGLSLLAPLAGLATFLVLMIWNDAAFHEFAMDESGLWSSVPSAAAGRFLEWMLAAGAAATLAAIAGTLSRPVPQSWGALGAGAGFLFVWGAWARVDPLLSAAAWAWLATGFALLLLLGVWLARRRSDDAGGNLAAGLLAAASAACLVFGLDRLFDGIWLTLLIAVLAAAYALATHVLKPKLLGPVSAALASLAAIRLFVSRELWLDDRALPLGEHWVIYGYGLPAALFVIAGRWLKAVGHLKSAITLEGISLGLIMSLVALELRVLISGGIAYEEPQFLEMAAHVLTWLGAAYGLLHRQRLYSSFVSFWGARILTAAGIAGIVLGSLLFLNPVVTGEPVPGNMVFNALLLAYLAPVLVIGLLARKLDLLGWQSLRPAAGGLALVLAFVYLTLETKRIFQGRILVPWSESIAESYAYSAVWLAFALALFVAGIRLGRQYVRYAGLGVMVLVVLKVFLWDMSSLEGLYRIASFVGLGFCLVGIGWLYQHFVHPAKADRLAGHSAPAGASHD